VVEHRATTVSPGIAKVLIRAVAILLVLGVGWFGITKVLDAQPGSARTLASKAGKVTAVDPKAPPLKKVVLSLNDLPAGWA
jgi:hypothetical protein